MMSAQPRVRKEGPRASGPRDEVKEEVEGRRAARQRWGLCQRGSDPWRDKLTPGAGTHTHTHTHTHSVRGLEPMMEHRRIQ